MSGMLSLQKKENQRRKKEMSQEDGIKNQEDKAPDKNRQGLLEREVWLEGDLADFFCVKPYAVKALRDRGLPFVKLNSTRRIYLETSVLHWLENQEVVAKQ